MRVDRKMVSDHERAPPPQKEGAFMWTEEKWEKLRSLAGGSLSARQIAEIMGCTRNAIVGACHRRGIRLSGNASVVVAQRIYKRKMDISKKTKLLEGKPIYKAREEPETKPIPPSFKPLNKYLWEMDRWECRYSTGEATEGIYFCGHSTPIGSPWCSYHRPMLFYKVPKKPKA